MRVDGRVLVKKLLKDKKASLIVVKEGNILYVGYNHGLRDLAFLIRSSPRMLNRAYIADKVVGKAAAIILTYHKVSYVYALVLSKYGLKVLAQEGIPYEYEELVSSIRNPKGDLCPFERLVLDIDDLEEAYNILIKELMKFN